jgi:RNA polymerase sigma factor (sigma-70 family)
VPAADDPDPQSILVQKASSGDRTAIESLLARYLPALSIYVARHAGAALRQKESRSDLVQSVCREVLEDLRSAKIDYRGEAQFRQWLYKAALRKIQGRGRYFGAQRRAAGREVPIADAPSAEHGLQHSRTPSRSAASGEELARFRASLQQLDDTSRSVVEWAWFDEMPHKDVAARLGITEAHSRTLLSRALARIAKLATGTGA